MKWRAAAMSMFVSCVLGCGDGDAPASSAGSVSSGGGADSAVSSGGCGGAAHTSSTSSATGGVAGAGASAASGAGGAAPLPGGSREYGGVVNLVSPSGPTELEDYLINNDASIDLAELTRRFFEFYPDEYDFIIFVLPYALPADTTSTFASFDVINRPVIPGTGIDRAVHKADFGTHGRLKGVIGTQGDPAGGRPPFAHELLHYWANYLDNAAFGFGVDLDYDYGAHWGHVSVFGQLGGFDRNTLACVEPAGGLPPDCTPEDNGRVRYRMSAYGANTNSFKGVDYAPLELYLMGLVAIDELPDPMLVLTDPQYVSIDIDGDTVVTEAAGMQELSPTEIVAVHGARDPTPEAERQLSAAFVVVSDAPIDDATLGVFANWSDVLGNHRASARSSFQSKTGGLMTLSTRIGRRRTADDP